MFIVLSDYFKSSNTIISTCITLADKVPSNYTDQQIIDIAFIDLKLSYPNLPKYDIAYAKKNSEDTAFIDSINTNRIPYKSINFNNLYNCGTQNGSHYQFTSMESATYSAINLAHELEPSTKNIIELKETWTLKYLIFFLVLILIIYYVITKKINLKSNLKNYV